MKVWDPDKMRRYRFCQIKRDGWSVQICKDNSGHVSYWTRSWNRLDLSWMRCHEPICRSMRVGTQLNGEIWQPTQDATQVKTLINNKSDQLKIELFSVGKGYEETQGEFDRLQPLAVQMQLSFVPWWDFNAPTAQRQWASFESLWEQYKFNTDPSVEGFVMKRNAFDQEPVKWKPFKDADLLVVGYKPGTPGTKNEGLVGSLECALRDGTVVANVSGMTDEQRQHMTENIGDYVGKVVEVKYQKVEVNGGLRHPSFIRVREDKQQADESL